MIKSPYIFISIGVFLCVLSNLYSNDLLIEAKAAYFYPTDSTFRSIYNEGGLYSIEANYGSCRKIYPWASVGIFSKSGHTIAEDTKTHIIIVPLALGLKYQYCWKYIKPYLGLGVLASYLRTNDESPFVIKIRDKCGAGAVVKFGIVYDITRCFFTDFFLDYYWTKINFKDTDKTTGRRADISGLAIGAGIGYHF